MGVHLDLEPFQFDGVPTGRPLVIAGPCSAESKEQVMSTATQLKEMGIQIFRAGIWKPRTRPNTFEGVGIEGLHWLKKVQHELGMLTATEVANANHVFEALKCNVDILWIGARTTANPFAVQEIADALNGVHIPVMIKNPVNPDVELWIGAFERLNQAGIKKLAAIHRGFSSYGKTLYRNDPHWQIPIELKRRIPNVPMITDPSHICGNRDMLLEVSQEAMDLNFEGLIVETHCNPEKALSDASQQITPKEFSVLLSKLILRQATVDNTAISHSLEDLRAQVDKFDDNLLEILCKRMQVSDRIGMVKKENNITVLQSGRWNQLLTKRIQDGVSRGLSEDFVAKVFRAIHEESINHQMKIMND